MNTVWTNDWEWWLENPAVFDFSANLANPNTLDTFEFYPTLLTQTMTKDVVCPAEPNEAINDTFVAAQIARTRFTTREDYDHDILFGDTFYWTLRQVVADLNEVPFAAPDVWCDVL